MAAIRRGVRDVLQPDAPSTLEPAPPLAAIDGRAGGNAAIGDVGRTVQTVTFTIAGAEIEDAAVESTVQTAGVAVRSLDQVVRGDTVGRKAVKNFARPGYRRTSDRYVRQYEQLVAESDTRRE